MDDATRTALHRSQVIDLTTTGRRTGQQRRIEIFLHDLDGLLFITGTPRADRTRDWIYNIKADPRVVIHLKRGAVVDLPATARVITDPDEGRPLIEAAARRWGRTDVDEMLRTAHSSCSTRRTALRIAPPAARSGAARASERVAVVAASATGGVSGGLVDVERGPTGATRCRRR